jgi:hypothetical protein
VIDAVISLLNPLITPVTDLAGTVGATSTDDGTSLDPTDTLQTALGQLQDLLEQLLGPILDLLSGLLSGLAPGLIPT